MANQTNTAISPLSETMDDISKYPNDLRKKRRPRETIIQAFLFVCGALSIFTTVGIVYGLTKESIDFFTRQQWEETNKSLATPIDANSETLDLSTGGGALEMEDVIRINEEIMVITGINGSKVTVLRGEQKTLAVPHSSDTDVFQGFKVSILEFFTGTKWNPQIGQFGIWPLVTATLMTSFIAMLVSLPLGLSVAIYLSEYASERSRSVLKPILEILAGIPTVVYGYFALTFMTPLLRSVLGRDGVEIYNTAAAGIVIGVLIFPYVSSMSEDALHAVPRSLREASLGLGTTKLETAIWVIVPAAFSGITAAFIVAISRAIGETMIVAIAAGAGPNFTFNPFMPAETMTGHIVRISGGDISYDSIDYNSIFAIGLMLFFITLALNIISQRIVKKYREVYE